MAEAIAGTRGGTVAGPFAIWMHLPDVAERASDLGNRLRFRGRLERRLFELAVLAVARRWGAQYEWFAHESAARQAGVPEDVIQAIRVGQRPSFQRADEVLVYRIAEAAQAGSLKQGLYDEGVAALGLELMIELITVVGYYTMIALVLNAFEAPVPGGARPLPEV